MRIDIKTSAIRRQARSSLRLALLFAAGVVPVASAQTAPPPAAPTGGIAGQVVVCPGGTLGEVEVLLVAPDDSVRTVELEQDGRFTLEGLAPRTFELHAYTPGCEPASYRVEVKPGTRTPLRAELKRGEVMEQTIDVVGRQLSAGEERAASAEAVKVVELEQAHQQTADLGEVLSRNSGVNVQRAGGLGSSSRLSLNGLSGDQVRFFLDGVPLELMGFGSGLANVPVNLLERVEVYRGVVPVRFGADALGGVVNLVSADGDGDGERGAAVSLQTGSFGTWRGLVSGHSSLGPHGLFVRGHAFGDLARNDYLVDVMVSDAQGRLSMDRVRRFHDAYAAAGGGLELGLADRPFAELLSLRLFATGSDKELQHNPIMEVPYGEATTAERSYGAMLHWKSPSEGSDALRFDLVAGYSRRDTDFEDTSMSIYNWYGQIVDTRRQAGEIVGGDPADQILWQHSVLARLNAAWSISDAQELRFSLAPTFITRRGDDRLTAASQRDPLTAQRDLLTAVAGAEHELRLLDGSLEQVTFLKAYLMRSDSEEVLPGDHFVRRDQANQRLGAGTATRLLLSDGLQAKASYEYATRLPGADEIFGDGVSVGANLGLRPETSHNVNVELAQRDRRTAVGALRGSLGGFARLADDLILLTGNDRTFTYENVQTARALGVEASAGWTVPSGWLTVDANGTWQDFRNVSEEGTVGAPAGDRIPNQPWLFANLAVRLRFGTLFRAGDEVSLGVTSRYVHGFFRGAESRGLTDSKDAVPAQLTHAADLSYSLPGTPNVSATFEALNVTDARVYDFFGVQRPGRSFFVKLNVDL